MSYAQFPFLSSVGFTADQQRKILEVLNGKKIRPCAACGLKQTWQLVNDGVVNLPVNRPHLSGADVQAYVTPMFSNRGLPCIALMCLNCGNVQLHSVFQLGLGPVLGLILEPPPWPTGGQ
jgi:hypothetical protein